MLWLGRTRRQTGPSWRPVGYAPSEPEAQMLIDILRQHGVPAFVRGTPFAEVAGFPIACGRMLLVPSERLSEARAVLECIEAGGVVAETEPAA